MVHRFAVNDPRSILPQKPKRSNCRRSGVEHPVSGRRRTVFLIYSDESARVTHETILRTEGYDILSASDAARALAQVREQPPDLVLVGEKIGRMSVVQLIRMIKQDGTLVSTRICVCGSMPMREELRAAGADVVMIEPVAASELVREVAILIGRA